MPGVFIALGAWGAFLLALVVALARAAWVAAREDRLCRRLQQIGFAAWQAEDDAESELLNGFAEDLESLQRLRFFDRQEWVA